MIVLGILFDSQISFFFPKVKFHDTIVPWDTVPYLITQTPAQTKKWVLDHILLGNSACSINLLEACKASKGYKKSFGEEASFLFYSLMFSKLNHRNERKKNRKQVFIDISWNCFSQETNLENAIQYQWKSWGLPTIKERNSKGDL